MMTTYISIIEDPNTDWRAMTLAMKHQVRLSVCSHIKETKGVFVDKWGCGREKRKDDLCERPSSNKNACISWLSVRFSIDDEAARKLLTHLKNLNWITIYECSAVFFHA